MVSKSSPIPLYCQIKASLERDIDSGKLTPGAKMPSELELAAMHHVSRTTARQALQKLCEAGLVVRFQGKGTFVRSLAETEPAPERGSFPSATKSSGASALAAAPGPAPGLRPQRTIRLVSYRDGEDICFDRTQQNLVRGIEREARNRGCDLILSSCMEGDRELSSLMERRSEAGLLLYGEFTSRFDAAISRSGIPAIAVDCSTAKGAMDCVLVDQQGAARLATEHLLGLGHTAIAYLGGSRMRRVGQVEEWPVSRRRREGFLATLKAAGRKAHADNTLVEFTTQRHAYRAAWRLFDRIHKPSAIIAFSPSQALGVEAAAAKAGLRIPEDLSLICFSDIEQVCFRGDLTFTTIWSDSYAMGRQALRLLFERIEQPSRPPQTIKLSPQFWAGDTCGSA